MAIENNNWETSKLFCAWCNEQLPGQFIVYKLKMFHYDCADAYIADEVRRVWAHVNN